MFDVETALLVATAVLNAGLFVFVVAGHHKNLVNGSFGAFVLCLSVWSCLHVGFRTVSSDATAVALLKLSYVCALFIGASFYYFSLAFPDGRLPETVHVVVFAAATFMLSFAIMTPGFLTGLLLHEPYGRAVLLRMGDYLAFTVLFCGLFLGGQIRIWLKFCRAQGIARMQLLTLGLSVSAVGLIAMYFDLVLPSPFFENFRYVWAGPVLTSMFAIVTTYAIFRYRLFKLKAAVAELLVFTWWLFILVRALTANSSVDFVADQGLLALAAPIGALLIRSLGKEERSRDKLRDIDDIAAEIDR